MVRTRIRRTRAFYLEQYRARLKELRQYFDRFDYRYNEKHLDKLDSATRRLLKSRVNRAYRSFRPFINRPKKVVPLPRDKIKRKGLLKYAGVDRFKGLKRIPVITYGQQRSRIHVDKRGHVQITAGRYKEKTYYFPRKARKADDFIVMAEEMLQWLPQGSYVLRTRRHELLHRTFERDLMVEEIALFLLQYGDNEEFVNDLIGVKWMGRNEDRIIERVRGLRKVRADLKRRRKTLRQKVTDKIKRARAEQRKVKRKVAVKRIVKRKVAVKRIVKRKVTRTRKPK